MPYHVFIASMSREKDLAQDLAQRVQEAGAETLVRSEPVFRGESVDLTLRRNLKRADEVIVLLTDRSLDSPDLLFELGAAFSLHKRVTPVLVGIEERDVPPLIRQFKYVRYTDLRSYLSELEKRANPPADGSPVAAAY